MWGGLFEVEPGARTGIHHHGEQQTIAYVLSGVCEVLKKSLLLLPTAPDLYPSLMDVMGEWKEIPGQQF